MRPPPAGPTDPLQIQARVVGDRMERQGKGDGRVQEGDHDPHCHPHPRAAQGGYPHEGEAEKADGRGHRGPQGGRPHLVQGVGEAGVAGGDDQVDPVGETDHQDQGRDHHRHDGDRHPGPAHQPQGTQGPEEGDGDQDQGVAQ